MENPNSPAGNGPAARNSSFSENKAPPRHVAGIGNSKVRHVRAHGYQVDGVLGSGREDMGAEFISRSLARIIRKGIRTGYVREIGNGSFVLSPELPAGTFALRTADRIVLYRSETAAMIATVPLAATDGPRN